MKKIVGFFVKRPVTATMFIGALLFVGILALTALKLELYPDVNMPYASVQVTYSGTSPQEMDNLVAEQVIDGISGISGIKQITSRSGQGFTYVMVECNFGTDMNYMVFQLQSAVDKIRRNLPTNADEPIIQEFNIASSSPSITLSLSGTNQIETRDYAENILKDKLEQVNDVASVDIDGGLEREFVVDLNPYKLQAYKLSINDIYNTLQMAYANLPGGTFNQGGQSITIKANEEIDNLNDLQNSVIYQKNGETLRLKDVAHVYVGSKERNSYARFDGKSTVALSVMKTSDGNDLDISTQIKALLPEINKELPSGMHLNIADDTTSSFLMMFINMVKDAAILGLIFACVIVFLFLKNIRATIIIGVAIPFSIIMTFILLHMRGFSLNMMTLFGLMLGVGMLVDNSVIVLENIYRHMNEYKKDAKTAAIDGGAEISMAVVLSTASTCVVFLPIAFIKALIGQWFTPFSFAISFAVLSSLIISLTIVPMLASKFLTPDKSLDKDGKIYGAVKKGYVFGLGRAIKFKWITVAFAFIVFILTLVIGPKIVGMEFFPKQDQNVYTVTSILDGGANLDKTNSVAKQIEGIIEKNQYTKSYTTIVRKGQLNVVVNLDPISKRKIGVWDIMNEVRPLVSQIPDTKINLSATSSHGRGGSGAPLSVDVTGSDEATLLKYANDVESVISKTPGTLDVQSSYERGTPEAQVTVDRVKAESYGLTPQGVTALINAITMGTTPFQIKSGTSDYDVMVQYDEGYRNSVYKLKNLMIPLSSGNYIPLSDVATVKVGTSPAMVERKGKELVMTITANIKGNNLSGVIKDVSANLDKIDFPSGYGYSYSGDAQDMKDSMGQLMFAFLVAIILVYMMLASLFESFIAPFIIIVSVPLAIIGVYIGLTITGFPMSAPVMLGIIMLAGIVVNNSIVLIDYILIRRAEGESAINAVKEACSRRLRPILITACTTSCGMLPTAIGMGSGADFIQPLAVAVIFGLMTSTCLTLFVVPSLYLIFDSIISKFKK